MNKAEELANKMIIHMKLYNEYFYDDVYADDKEALDNLKPLFNSEKGITNQIDYLLQDISMISKEKDLEDEEIRKIFNSAVNLIKEFNKQLYYFKNKEKEKIM